MKPMDFSKGERSDVAYIIRGNLEAGFKGVALEQANLLANKNIYTFVKVDGGALLEANADLPKPLLAGMAKINDGLKGALGAAIERVERGAATAAPVLQGNAELTSTRPGQTRTLTTPTLKF